MVATISRINHDELERLISSKISPTMGPEELGKFNLCMNASTIVWGGIANGELLCLWGLMPPSLLSDQAYLWLYIVRDISDYEFVFVRHSQRAIEEALRHFPTITGHCKVDAEQSIRWIKWLGGRFGEPDGGLVPFVIRRRSGD